MAWCIGNDDDIEGTTETPCTMYHSYGYLYKGVNTVRFQAFVQMFSVHSIQPRIRSSSLSTQKDFQTVQLYNILP